MYITRRVLFHQVVLFIFFILQEYNKRETAEAKIVKDLDRFEMILQAYEYERGEW